MTDARASRSRSIAAGMVAGLMLVAFTTSFAALIHADAPTGALSVLVALFLAGAAIVNLVAARWGSVRGVVLLPQGPPAAIAAATLVALLPGVAGEDRLGTAIVFVALTTGLSGVAMLALAFFGGSEPARLVPKPVAGGILAGSGLVLLVGGARIASNGYQWSTPTVLSLLGALAFAAVVVTLVRRRPGAPIFPMLVLVACGLFHLVLAISGMDPAAARTSGVLLPSSSTGLTLPLGDLGRADLGAILSGWAGAVLVAGAAVLGLLFNVRALNLLRRTDLDVRRDLKVVGLANGVSAITGMSAAYPSLGLTALGLRSRTSGPTLTMTAAGVAVVAALAAVPLVAYFPAALVGGLLMGVGLSLATDWFLDAARSMRLPEVGMMAILAVAVALGWFVVALALAVIGGTTLHLLGRNPPPHPDTPTSAGGRAHREA